MTSGTKWMVVLILMLSATLAYSCGGDDDDTMKEDDGKDDMPAAGSTAAPMAPEGAVLCGTETCTVPEGSTVEACCFDAFTSTCGMMMPGSPNCVAVVTSFEGCPSLMAGMGIFNLASCCTEDGQCGLDASLFGTPGCTELSAVMAMVPAMAQGFITIPAPMACP